MKDIIVITGASAGIGKALTLNLAKEGKHVCAIGRNEHNLLALKKNQPDYIHIIAADVATEEGRHKIKDNIPSQMKISHLVHNAGLMTPSGLLENLNVPDWRYQMSVNVEAPLFLTTALLPKLKGGRLLNLTIYSSFKPLIGLGAYGTSKAALNMLTQYLRVELNKYNIEVGIALPGIVDTNIQTQLSPNDCKTIIEQNNKLREAGKLLSPQISAAFLKWLLLETNNHEFRDKVWDIYDLSHHSYWAKGMDVPTIG